MVKRNQQKVKALYNPSGVCAQRGPQGRLSGPRRQDNYARIYKIFNGYRHAYGIADWTNAVVDPESGKKKPVYRWNYEESTDVIYQEHLAGNISVGIQPTNEKGSAIFGVIDVDPKKYENFDKQFYLETIQEYKLPSTPNLSLIHISEPTRPY